MNTYSPLKPMGWEKMNPVQLALANVDIHLSSIHGILINHAHPRDVELNLEIHKLVDKANDWLEEQGFECTYKIREKANRGGEEENTHCSVTVDEKSIRTLLDVLTQAEYELYTTHNLCVTDKPDLVPEAIKFTIDFSKTISLMREQISLWEKLVDNRTNDCS